ncbi:hypothetical protein C8R44DRAFT_896134 [Mycena epipterygia]|nr:hypothetical protein C8R44DRAFT_896134 [Mycena epipterygia]
MSLRHRRARGQRFDASFSTNYRLGGRRALRRCVLPTSTSRYGLHLFHALRVPAHVYAACPFNPSLPRPARTLSSAPAIVWHPGERTGPPYAQVERTAVHPRVHPPQPPLSNRAMSCPPPQTMYRMLTLVARRSAVLDRHRERISRAFRITHPLLHVCLSSIILRLPPGTQRENTAHTRTDLPACI